MTNQDFENILSYYTITYLHYGTGHDAYEIRSNPDVLEQVNKIEKLTNLKKLKNLEKLTIEYDASYATGIGSYDYYLG